MASKHTFSRRSFLKASAGLGALAAFGKPGFAFATTAGDYKALVCIYLAGGCDGNNMVIPLDAARYSLYQQARGYIAVPPSKVQSTSFTSGGMPYAFHYGLASLHQRYTQGKAAVVLNTGNLIEPLVTKNDYTQNLKRVPSNLFSHSDQMVQIQMGGVPREDFTGWGGRLLDCVHAGNTSLGAISTASGAPFIVSSTDSGNVVPPGQSLTLNALGLWPQAASVNRRQAIVGLLAADGGSLLRQAANRAFSEGMQLGTDLQAASAQQPITTPFPASSLGNQLKLIASLIRLRASQGPGRQVFIATLGGWDTHTGQDWMQWDLFLELDAAMDSFQTCMEQELLLSNKVTTFSLTEFGRTLQTNGQGSDHGWGNHQFVVGGAVKGGLYGQLPNFQLVGPDDANTRGVWIPKISTEQFAATLGKWFGASDDDLAWAFPSIELFPAQDLGFML
jgi:uncharacterized protein (DUF1501 family)